MPSPLVPISKVKLEAEKFLFPLISNYNRLEGSPRSKDFGHSLRMEMRDPLWTLCRQWQFGEFQAEDAGTPFQASILGKHTKPKDIVLKSGERIPYDHKFPLETLIEQESLPPTMFLKAQMGRHLLMLLKSKKLKKYQALMLEKYPLEGEALLDDEEGRFFTKGIQGLLPDGFKIHQDIKKGTFPDWISGEAQIEEAHRPAFLEVADAFTKWFATLYQQPAKNQSAWVPEHLEYSFSLESNHQENGIRLVADQYCSGHLDWKDFDQELIQSNRNREEPTTGEDVLQTFIPNPLKFSGMPHPRLWQMEDQATDFGKIEASPTALLNLLLAEYGLTYSNDWFILPYELDINTICQIEGIVVKDVFGQYMHVAPSIKDPEMNWQEFAVFHQTERQNSTQNESVFYMAPSVGKLLEGEDLEKVNFIRDEMSNMVWAIEQVVSSEAGSGRMLKRHVPDLAEFTPFETEAQIRYVLGNTVPDNWIPFIPVQKETAAGEVAREIRLQRARMPQGTRPISRIVSETKPVFFIEEEEIPRAGVIIRRNFQRTRWLNGKTYLWVGRRKQAGRGEGIANLMFDQIIPIKRENGQS
ncbi:hypothetical protein [Rufibacter latericius]|uniref:Uncharacterized protein n=1 Tax=Rufibacter latericius TaxID=2487040 RepID=A0A3M9MYX9_9BACT|nr:hypothetical protein [Rufibacter latericius]RNI30686.1 hypothetical protein EFB08_05415 [Rufibacter latericius]